MQQINAKITNNQKLAPAVYCMSLSAPAIVKTAQPGQFIMVRCAETFAPLLRRPFSIHSARKQKTEDRGQIEILYEIVGEGTEILSQKKTGEHLDIIGPLGNGFNWCTSAPVHQSPVLIAGGIGVAPLLFLAERLVVSVPVALLGAKTKSHILCEKEFKALGCDVRIATDDGSKGYKGFVTDLLKDLLVTGHWSLVTSIYACGPNPMLQEVAEISRRYKIPVQVCLEEHMACGIGACLGCVVQTIDGYKRVCKEGPVFDANWIIWEE